MLDFDSYSLRLGQADEGPLRGTFSTIMYLQRLGLEHFELILEYSKWVLRANPEEGMQVGGKSSGLFPSAIFSFDVTLCLFRSPLFSLCFTLLLRSSLGTPLK